MMVCVLVFTILKQPNVTLVIPLVAFPAYKSCRKFSVMSRFRGMFKLA